LFQRKREKGEFTVRAVEKKYSGREGLITTTEEKRGRENRRRRFRKGEAWTVTAKSIGQGGREVTVVFRERKTLKKNDVEGRPP